MNWKLRFQGQKSKLTRIFLGSKRNNEVREKMMSKIDSILFDLDGTLWSSAKAISEAWGLVLQKHEDIEKKR